MGARSFCIAAALALFAGQAHARMYIVDGFHPFATVQISNSSEYTKDYQRGCQGLSNVAPLSTQYQNELTLQLQMPPMTTFYNDKNGPRVAQFGGYAVLALDRDQDLHPGKATLTYGVGGIAFENNVPKTYPGSLAVTNYTFKKTKTAFIFSFDVGVAIYYACSVHVIGTVPIY